MTTLFRSSRRAEEFAALVDGLSTVRTVDDAATERLVGLTRLLRVRGADDPAALPRQAFATDLRERLMTEAATVLTPSVAGLALPARTRGKRERRLVAVASAAVLLGGTAGMATAAQSALPGEALYPIKRGIEQVEVRLSTSSAARGRDLLHQASTRLGEAQSLIGQGSTGSPQVPHTLESFATQARQGSDLLMAAYADSRDPQAIASVREFAASALTRLAAMDTTAPPEAQGDLHAAALALRDIDGRASRLCGTCADLPALTMPKAFLASAEVDRAIARFQAAQPDNSHPVIASKQDVRRAASGSRVGSGVGSKKAPAVGGTSTDGGAVPTLPAAPSAPAPTSDAPLPKVSVSGRIPKVSVDASADPGAIADGLGDTVETILPDVGGGGLLP
jgi:hypothetical protein